MNPVFGTFYGGSKQLVSDRQASCAGRKGASGGGGGGWTRNKSSPAPVWEGLIQARLPCLRLRSSSCCHERSETGSWARLITKIGCDNAAQMGKVIKVQRPWKLFIADGSSDGPIRRRFRGRGEKKRCGGGRVGGMKAPEGTTGTNQWPHGRPPLVTSSASNQLTVF